MNISLAAEPVLRVGTFSLTNSALTATLVTVVLIIVAVALRTQLRDVPRRFQGAIEMIYDFLLTTTENVIGRPDIAREIFPYILTAFFFIVFSNWSGLIPGFGSFTTHGDIPVFRAPTSDLNMVIALALCSVIYVQYLGIKYKGARNYLSTFFNFQSPIYFFVGIIELISELIRPISYSFRLFGNIFAGEVLLTVIIYLNSTFLPYFPIIPIPFFALELFVGLIQGLVFCFLTIVFTAIAIGDHGEPHLEPEHASIKVTS